MSVIVNRSSVTVLGLAKVACQVVLGGRGRNEAPFSYGDSHDVITCNHNGEKSFEGISGRKPCDRLRYKNVAESLHTSACISPNLVADSNFSWVGAWYSTCQGNGWDRG